MLVITDHARTPPAVEATRENLEQQFAAHALPPVEEAIRWTSWQTIAGVLDSIRAAQSAEGRELIDDVLAIKRARGVRRMFEGFRRSDYWLIAAARDAAQQRVYPAISELSHELIGCSSRIASRGAPRTRGRGCTSRERATNLPNGRWPSLHFRSGPPIGPDAGAPRQPSCARLVWSNQ